MKLLSPPRMISLSLHLVGFGVHAQLLPAMLASVFTKVKDINTMSYHFFFFPKQYTCMQAGVTFRNTRNLILRPCVNKRHSTSKAWRTNNFKSWKNKMILYFHLKNLISFFRRLFLRTEITSFHFLKFLLQRSTFNLK